MIYERIEEEDESPDGYDADHYDGEEREEEKEEKKEEEEEEKDDDDAPNSVTITNNPPTHQPSRSKAVTQSSVMVVNPHTNAPEPVNRAEPLPRIQASMIVSGHTLYIYGGLLEVGDREVTLDDLWSFDLRKRENWECIWPGTMHKQVWRGAVHDDDDSYSTDTGKHENDDDDDDDESTDDELGDNGHGDETALAKKSGSKQEIAVLNEKYNLGDDNLTPKPDEVLADFYSRTKDYWNDQAAIKIRASSDGAEAEFSKKELKREAFSLAQVRFEELEHVMERLKEISLQSKDSKKYRKEPPKDRKGTKSEKSMDTDKEKTKKKSHRLEH
jgi:hypothetical protein